MLTVPVAIVRSHFLSDADMLDDPKSNVPAFAKEFNIVVAVVLEIRIEGEIYLSISTSTRQS